MQSGGNPHREGSRAPAIAANEARARARRIAELTASPLDRITADIDYDMLGEKRRRGGNL